MDAGYCRFLGLFFFMTTLPKILNLYEDVLYDVLTRLFLTAGVPLDVVTGVVRAVLQWCQNSFHINQMFCYLARNSLRCIISSSAESAKLSLSDLTL